MKTKEIKKIWQEHKMVISIAFLFAFAILVSHFYNGKALLPNAASQSTSTIINQQQGLEQLTKCVNNNYPNQWKLRWNTTFINNLNYTCNLRAFSLGSDMCVTLYTCQRLLGQG